MRLLESNCKHFWSLILGAGLLIWPLQLGCSPVQKPRRLPGNFEIPSGSITLRSDHALNGPPEWLADLHRLKQDLEQALGIPLAEAPVDIYLFAERASLRDYLRRNYPGLEDRRAVFIKTGGELRILACRGEWLEVDLRHELTHAWLHQHPGPLPLWLDEGLAEYFESERPGAPDCQPDHCQLLAEAAAAGDWHPNLARLAGRQDVASFSRLDYAEAWLWTNWLLNEAPPSHRRVWQSWWQQPPRERTELSAMLLALDQPPSSPQIPAAINAN